MILLRNKVALILVIMCMSGMKQICAKNFKDNIHNWQTQQGANVYFYPTADSPIVQFGLIFGAGCGVDEQHGPCMLANDLLNYDSKLSDRASIKSKLNNNGAVFTSQIDDGFTVFTVSANLFEQEFTNTILLFHNIIVTPVFNQKEFLRNKKESLDNANSTYLTPRDLYSRALLETIFTGHPMGRYVLPPDIEKIQKDDIINFYKRYYVAKNATLIIVGNLKVSEAKKVSEKILEDLPVGKMADSLKPFLPNSLPVKKRLFIQDNAVQQTSIKFGEAGILSNDPDFMALRLGMDILAGGSLSSRMPNIMRNEHGYSYSTTCEMIERPYRGFFYCESLVSNANAPEALHLMLTTLRQYLHDGPSEAEVERAKNNLRLKYYTINSNSDILQVLILMAKGYNTWDYYDQFLSRLDKTTPEQIKIALQKHIKLEQLTFIVWGPKDIRYVIKPALLKLH